MNTPQAIEHCFTSPNVADSNMEPANLVDVVDRVARNLRSLALAVTADAAPVRMSNGAVVGSLTEAGLYVGENLGRIADAIDNLASAVDHQ